MLLPTDSAEVLPLWQCDHSLASIAWLVVWAVPVDAG